MKKISVLFLMLLLAMLTVNVDAQIFSGGVGVIGTSNAVVQNSFVTQTNFAYVSLPARTLQLQGINTNESATVSYNMCFSGFGLTNLWLSVSNQFTFPASNGFVQGQNFTTNIAPFSFAIPVTPVGQIMIYTNGVAPSSISAISNNVILQ